MPVDPRPSGSSGSLGSAPAPVARRRSAGDVAGRSAPTQVRRPYALYQRRSASPATVGYSSPRRGPPNSRHGPRDVSGNEEGAGSVPVDLEDPLLASVGPPTFPHFGGDRRAAAPPQKRQSATFCHRAIGARDNGGGGDQGEGAPAGPGSRARGLEAHRSYFLPRGFGHQR